jgi:tricorn protease
MGMIMFNRYYYPQLRKKALVIDARHNGGGFVSQLIIERLAREVVAYGTARNSRQDYTYPDKTFEGPMGRLDQRSGRLGWRHLPGSLSAG